MTDAQDTPGNDSDSEDQRTIRERVVVRRTPDGTREASDHYPLLVELSEASA